MALYPYILAGGSGTRLWPVSDGDRPKQLRNWLGGETLFQRALLLARATSGKTPAVIAGSEHRFVVAEQARKVGLSGCSLILEPAARGTAPAAILAALHALHEANGTDALVLLMPSDHVISDVSDFSASIRTAAETASAGAIVALGIEPTGPETAYGYIKAGAAIGDSGVLAVAQFIEKPDAATAKAHFSSGEYLWNAGIFVFSSRVLLSEAARLMPRTVRACRRALDGCRRDADFIRLDPAAFDACETVSLDRGILEKTTMAGVLPVSFPWADLGSWNAIWRASEQDADGNAVHGEAALLDCEGCLFYGGDRLLAGIGLKDLAVVETDEAVLVLHRGSAERVKTLARSLRRTSKR
jgi:mannose-1-phosphate guanylyltransferase/mannose-6-phosphate isomerase